MSRTKPNPTGSKNPATKFMSWKSQSKGWAYWDKEQETEVLVHYDDLAFIVLDQLNTAKGFDERAHSGIWANEVRRCGSDPMTLRNKDGIIAEGLWKDIKGTNGAKFTKSVYVMAKIGGDYELVNLQLSGAALTTWLEFCDASGNLEGDIVVATQGVKEGRKGAVTYFMPEFSIISRTLSDEAATLADKLDSELQDYLTEYLSNQDEDMGTTPTPSSTPSNPTNSEQPSQSSIGADSECPF